MYIPGAFYDPQLASLLLDWGPAQSQTNHGAVSEMRVLNGISSTRLPQASACSPSFPFWRLWPSSVQDWRTKGCFSESPRGPAEPGLVQKFNESNSYAPSPVPGLSEESKSRVAYLWGTLHCVNLRGGIKRCILWIGVLPSKSLMFGWNVMTNHSRGKS